MKWKKLGLIYGPQNFKGGGYSHAANPFPVYLGNDLYRIYFNRRDKCNRSSITYLDYNIIENKIIRVAEKNILEPGEPGLFDDSGCSLGCILKMPDNSQYMYYLGWNLGVTVPWMNYIGLAICKQNETFMKYSPLPILERNPIDYMSCSYPYVLKDNDKYRMWYGSNVKWGRNKTDMNHVIKYAESEDGIRWKRNGLVCIVGKDETEYAFSKPTVMKEDGIYKMWYSFRGKAYRIGYAESTDGLSWSRMDSDVGIDVSLNGWDSEMLDYPVVFRHNDNVYMLYCGNGYGQTGFGLAVRVHK